MMCCPMWQCGKKCGMWLEPLVYVSTVCVCMWPHIACCQLLNWQHTLVHCVLECVLACGISRVKCLRVWHACEDFFLAPFRDYRMTLKCNHNRSSKLSLSIYVSISLRVSSMSVKINCFIWSALNWAFWPQMLMLKQYAQGLRNILLFIQCNQNNKESQIFYILPRIPRIFVSKNLVPRRHSLNTADTRTPRHNDHSRRLKTSLGVFVFVQKKHALPVVGSSPSEYPLLAPRLCVWS